jgi:DNA-binding NarL/FixJ family response regulator
MRESFVPGMNGKAAGSQHANAAEQRAITFPRPNPRPITVRTEVSVMILYADPVIAAGLAAVLREHGDFKVMSTPEPGESVHGLPSADVVLADYDTALHLAEFAPQWANNTVIFTNYDSEEKICRALESGAKGYLLYGVGLPQLFDGIRSVCGGGVALSPLVAARITNHVKGETLTVRERSVLEQLMLGLSNKAIARRLNVCVGTVKTHVKSILKKLGADSRTAAVVAAQRRGLLP